ncbi:carboxylesterase/lipase family protein [Rhizobium sp. CF142]|uniref:carboxylesterase/lipase family protein n=1 Tax=Rhizobium sp. CF142 TaxID=1144314 RepID=UPI00026EF29B|nr:carboxylesterase family protein [Rhizobium sp. CF142]EJJ29475.1 carboxylesterase type B [Rhizobium sp. CF142]
MPSSLRMGGTDPTVVETTKGRLRGSDAAGILSFRGIRYGQTTAGAHRFRAPLPAPRWAGIRDAISWGPSAPQSVPAAYTEPFYAWYSTIQPISEDCLFLNVVTPAADRQSRPVMVWLHGGGWRNFSASAPGTDGTLLAMQEDVVVVSLNHRLGALGYLALGQDDERFADAGNAGLLDIMLALQWVRDNIAAFGGDPENVTIFGQSGGGAKVAALMAVPAAAGLFHRAIIQSSSGGLRVASYQEAKGLSQALADTLGLARADASILQAVPLDTLLSAIERTPGYFRPSIDGRTFRTDPFFPAAPKISNHVPLLAGCTNTETTYYMRRNPGSFHLDLPDVEARLAGFLRLDAAATGRLIEAYRDLDSSAQPSDILIAVTTDYLFKRNTYRMASLREGAGAPSFAYVFSFETAVENGLLRSPHTCELPFIFASAGVARALVGHSCDIEPMTKTMMATWAQFARSGNPDNPTLPKWRPFGEPDRPVMVLAPESQLVADPGGDARAMLDGLAFYEYNRSRDDFWSVNAPRAT